MIHSLYSGFRPIQVQKPQKTLMGDFYVLLDWTIGCQDIWSKIILGVSVRVLRGEMNM